MPVIRGGTSTENYFPSKNLKKEGLIQSCSTIQESDISVQTNTTPGSRSTTPSTPSGGGSFAFSGHRSSSPAPSVIKVCLFFTHFNQTGYQYL
jgi:hypothetical protein